MSDIRVVSQDEILRELGIYETGPRAATVARAISNDNEVLNIADRLAREAQIPAALKTLDPQQRERLLKRTEAAQPANVLWAVGRHDQSGQAFVKAEFVRDAKAGLIDVEFFTCNPDRMKSKVYRGVAVPAEVVAAYKSMYKPGLGVAIPGINVQPERDTTCMPGPNYQPSVPSKMVLLLP